MTDSVVEVEVEVEPQAADPAPDVVVVAPDSGGSELPAELVTLLADMGNRLAALEANQTVIAEVAVEAAVEAEIAQDTADIALNVAESTAVETEEALATVAEEADAVTPEVIDEVEDVAPGREHPWFAKRKVMKRDE